MCATPIPIMSVCMCVLYLCVIIFLLKVDMWPNRLTDSGGLISLLLYGGPIKIEIKITYRSTLAEHKSGQCLSLLRLNYDFDDTNWTIKTTNTKEYQIYLSSLI